jgi:hypothetical protein
VWLQGQYTMCADHPRLPHPLTMTYIPFATRYWMTHRYRGRVLGPLGRYALHVPDADATGSTNSSGSSGTLPLVASSWMVAAAMLWLSGAEGVQARA